MNFYQAYNLGDVLEMKAVQFFLLLNESYRVDSFKKLNSLPVVAYPHLKESAQREVQRNLQVGAEGVDLSDYNDYSGITKLKESLK